LVTIVVLSAVVFLIGVGLIDINGMRSIYATGDDLLNAYHQRKQS